MSLSCCLCRTFRLLQQDDEAMRDEFYEIPPDYELKVIPTHDATLLCAVTMLSDGVKD